MTPQDDPEVFMELFKRALEDRGSMIPAGGGSCQKNMLEQFIARLPEERAAWVQCHQPELLDELAEAHMAAFSGAGTPT
ncbi:hypothetical protein AOLI_G00018180 [Acnodon oligacanthus]